MAAEQVVVTTLTVKAGQRMSDAFQPHAVKGILTGMSLIMPSALTSRSVQIEASPDGTAFYAFMYENALMAFTIPGRTYHLQAIPVGPYVRVACAATEAADRTFMVPCVYSV